MSSVVEIIYKDNLKARLTVTGSHECRLKIPNHFKEYEERLIKMSEYIYKDMVNRKEITFSYRGGFVLDEGKLLIFMQSDSRKSGFLYKEEFCYEL
jgi:hypothetical protein